MVRLTIDNPSGEDRAFQELKALLGQRINEGLSGAVSAKGFDAIVDEELRKV